MSRKITFLVEYENMIPFGKNKVTTDMSILFETSIAIGSFSIHPYHWSFELTTQEVSQNKYLLRYATGSLCLMNCRNTTLSIPESQRGKIYASFNFSPCADGIYYNQYSMFAEKKYFDTENKIFAVGDVSTVHQKCVEFASGQFAVINDLGELLAIYICMD